MIRDEEKKKKRPSLDGSSETELSNFILLFFFLLLLRFAAAVEIVCAEGTVQLNPHQKRAERRKGENKKKIKNKMESFLVSVCVCEAPQGIWKRGVWSFYLF